MPDRTGDTPAVDYQRLAEARTALALFHRRGAERAGQVGLTHVQHHLLLAVHTHPHVPGVGDVADQLALRPNSSAELVDRAAAGYLVRTPHPHDRRRVQLHLTALAQQHLAYLNPPQLHDLTELASALIQ